MSRINIFVSIILFLGISFCFAEESITITTYYPSPYGSYDSLQTNKLGIGDVDGDGSLDSDDVPTTAGDVWIRGRIEMGRLDPYNIFIGYQAGQSNTTGSTNIILGYNAGYHNTTGSNNIILGYGAGSHNTTGGGNTFLGLLAGYCNTTGQANTFLGDNAGRLNTTGDYNIFVGGGAGQANTTGSGNTFLGFDAGYNNTTGLGNVFIGFQAGQSETGSNKLYIDNSNTANPLIYGDFSANTVTINGQLSASTCAGCVSDMRFKKDITPINSALGKILKIKGVSFNWKEEYKDRGFPEGRHFGIVAQEIEKVLPEVVRDNPYKEKTISYTEIIPILIEAIKEQQKEIEILKQKIDKNKLCSIS